MGANAPSQIIVPQAYTAKTLKLENESIEIKGKKELTYLGTVCKSSSRGNPCVFRHSFMDGRYS